MLYTNILHIYYESQVSDQAAGRTSEESRFDWWQRQEVYLENVQTGFGAHPAFYSAGARVLPPGVKAAGE